MSLFTAGMLQYLWSMINTLQIVVLTVLFKLDIPVNAEMIMIMILQMCSLEFVPTETALSFMFTFRETNAFATEINSNDESFSKFEEAGYETANFWQLLGAIFFIAIGFGVLVLLKMLCKRAFKSFSENWLTRRLRRQNNTTW